MNYTKEQLELIEALKKECGEETKEDVRKELGYKPRSSEPDKRELAKKYLPRIIEIIRGSPVKVDKQDAVPVKEQDDICKKTT